jgi:hypothetical protein
VKNTEHHRTSSTANLEEVGEVFIDGSLEALDCSVEYRRGGRALAIATIGRDRANLEAEARMERDELR